MSAHHDHVLGIATPRLSEDILRDPLLDRLSMLEKRFNLLASLQSSLECFAIILIDEAAGDVAFLVRRRERAACDEGGDVVVQLKKAIVSICLLLEESKPVFRESSVKLCHGTSSLSSETVRPSRSLATGNTLRH